jgi:amidase
LSASPGPRLPDPTAEGLQRLASEFHFALSDSEAEQYLTAVVATVRGYAELDELPDAPRPPAYERGSGRPPSAGESPLNGWAWRCSIKGRAGGPLAGRTVAIKDNTAVAGLPLRLGTSVMGDFVPDEDATVVTRLLDAGAEIIGKTAVPSFCFDGAGFLGEFEPQVLNPADHGRVPGGSSSGSAALVTGGEVEIALGGDQGGSIRLPASFCGCVGHKPTYGLVPYTGIFPVERTLDHVGPLARTVGDCALALDAIAGPDGLDPRQCGISAVETAPQVDRGVEGLRIGILTEGFGIEGASEPEVDAAVRETANALSRLGAAVGEVSVPMHVHGIAIWSAIAVQGCADLVIRGDSVGTNAFGHLSPQLTDYFARARRELANRFPPTLKVTLLSAEHVRRHAHHHYYAKARALGRSLRDAYDRALSEYDVLVMPTTAMRAYPPPATGASVEEVVGAALGNLHNVVQFDVTGHPALSVPAPGNAGLPIGFQVVGRHLDDGTVLRVGAAVEGAG